MAIRPFVDRSPILADHPIDENATGRSVAVPIVTSVESTIDQVHLATALASGKSGDIHIFDPSSDPDSIYVQDAPVDVAAAIEGIQAWDTDRPNRTGVLSGRRTANGIFEYVREREMDTLVLPHEIGSGPLGRRRHDRLTASAPCDVVSINGEGRYEDFASILVPTAGGPYAGIAVDVAVRIATEAGAYIDLLHVLPEEADEAEEEAAHDRLAEVSERIGRPETVNPWVLRSNYPADAIVEQSAYYGLTIIGAPTSGRLKRFFHGSTSREIRREADSLVVAVRTPEIQDPD